MFSYVLRSLDSLYLLQGYGGIVPRHLSEKGVFTYPYGKTLIETACARMVNLNALNEKEKAWLAFGNLS